MAHDQNLGLSMPHYSDCSRLSDSDLVLRTKDMVTKERNLTLLVLEHLREIELRRLYAARGYSSLHSFAVGELGYSDGAAYRRIESMHLLKDVPQAKEAIQSGTMSLTTASTLQSFFKNEKRGRGKTYSKQEKAEFLESMAGKSKRQCERALFAISPQAIPQERERVVSPTQIEISFVASAELQEKIERLKGLLAHTSAAHSHAALIEKLADIALEKLDPLKKPLLQQRFHPPRPQQITQVTSLEKSEEAKKKTSSAQTSPAKSMPQENSLPSRHIPAPTRRQVWQRDQGACTYKDPKTQKNCGSHYKLQIDHLKPYALGGTHDLKNLTLRCQAHNLLSAQQVYGARKIDAYIAKVG